MVEQPYAQPEDLGLKTLDQGTNRFRLAPQTALDQYEFIVCHVRQPASGTQGEIPRGHEESFTYTGSPATGRDLARAIVFSETIGNARPPF
jgi:hypothetical protein